LTTFGTQDTGRRQTHTKHKKHKQNGTHQNPRDVIQYVLVTPIRRHTQIRHQTPHF